ncbi:carboxypeptidase-like regulatory domain-containing protein [Hymenobacter rubripertinctus]
MTLNLLSTSFIGGVALGLTACGNSTSDLPAPAATATTITGVVQARNETLQPVSQAGALVTLEGTTIKALTDAKGSYQLQQVPIGKHVLNVSRTGMGTMRYEANVVTLAPITAQQVTLDEESSTQVTGLRPVGRTSNSFPSEVAAFECTIRYNPDLYPAPKKFAMAVYVGKTNAVSNIEYLSSGTYGYSESTPAPAVRGGRQDRIAFHEAELQALGFKSGDQVYVVAYGSPVNISEGGIGNQAYYTIPYGVDPITNRVRKVTANLNSSPVRGNFTMP